MFISGAALLGLGAACSPPAKPPPLVFPPRPTITQVRAEVADHPCLTPRSLGEFAAALSTSIEYASHTDDVAYVETVLEELRECALAPREESIDSLSLFCLSNWESLARSRQSEMPRLWAEYERVRASFARPLWHELTRDGF